MTTLAGRAARLVGAPGEPKRRPVLRWSALVWLGALVVLLANDPGRMFFDTKLSVDLNAWGYYASLWHLMDPLNTFGALNNQAVGYAVPMAPFYLAGQLAHLPVWLIERLWLALIIAVGFGGLVKLAEALGIGSPASRFLAGLVFALWPTFTIVIGSTSSAALPGMLAPWAVLPLIPAVRGSSVVFASVRSAAVVLCMSGVNATVTIDALLLPGLFILTYARGRRLVALVLCWAAAVVMATAWWALPLLLQGKYAFNFLPYIEQAPTTTGTMSAAAVLRGAGNWTAYLNLGTPWLPAGWALVSTPMAIIAGAIAAGCGLYGLASRSMPYAGWLRLSAGLAAAVALAGYAGALGGPFHGLVDRLLDGTLAPFRNVYKLEPVIAAVLALGLAHAAAAWLARSSGRPSSGRLQRIFAMEKWAAVGLVLVGLMLPYLSGQVLNPGSFSSVPRYWYQAAAFLAARSPWNTALVVPADAHGDYLWGDPIDDPLVALASSPWAQLGLVPYGGAGAQILLGTAENAVESGEAVPGLAGYLQRAGVRYIVVRNDLDPRQVGYTSAVLVHQTLALSGFTRVASFGPPIGGAQIEPHATREQQSLLPSYPAVEVFAASGSAGLSGTPSPVSALPVASTMLVDGGPDSLLQLTGQGLLGVDQPAVIAGDPVIDSPPGEWAVTDGQRRADTLFGLVNSNVSYTYTATETNPAGAGQLGRAGGPPRQLLPVPAAGHQTVAVLSGAASVTVSSYGSWIADTQQDDPVNAFDGNPATSWAEGNERTPVGQWIQINFSRSLDLPASVGIRLLDDSTDREMASVLRVSTAAGSAVSDVAATGAVQTLRVVPGRTSWLRITITGARRVVLGNPGAGISDVLIPGVKVTRLLQPAETAQLAAPTVFSFHQQVPSPFAFADPAATPPMARTFTVVGSATWRLQASALALPGPALDALLDSVVHPPGPGVLQVSVASTAGAQPAGFPASLISGSASTPWTADTASPVIHLRWPGQRRIASMIVRPAAGLPSTPLTVKITSPDGTRQAPIGPGGLVQFSAPLTTNRMDVSFPRVRQATIITSTGQLETLPVRLSQLSVPALAGLRPVTPPASAGIFLACGQGPDLTVDGHLYQTSVSGTIGELTQYLPLQVRLCAPDGALSLGAGRRTLTAATPGTFAVTDLSLTGLNAAPVSSGGSRAVTVRSWQPDQRVVAIGSGAASYLEVHENYDRGWAATLNGRPLTPVRLDGWQQAFVVPAGAGGTVTMSFRPAGTYHVVLIVSILAAALLLAVATWSLTRRPRRGEAPPGSGSAESTGGRRTRSTHGAVRRRGIGVARVWLALVAVAALIFLAGGVVALGVAVVACAGCLAWPLRRPGGEMAEGTAGWDPAVRLARLALGAMVLSGLLSAVRPFGEGLFGPFGWPAQLCALVALAAALIPAGAVPVGGVPVRRAEEEDR